MVFVTNQTIPSKFTSGFCYALISERGARNAEKVFPDILLTQSIDTMHAVELPWRPHNQRPLA